MLRRALSLTGLVGVVVLVGSIAASAQDPQPTGIHAGTMGACCQGSTERPLLPALRQRLIQAWMLLLPIFPEPGG